MKISNSVRAWGSLFSDARWCGGVHRVSFLISFQLKRSVPEFFHFKYSARHLEYGSSIPSILPEDGGAFMETLLSSGSDILFMTE